jgi:SAM-dependent methyltransferase
MTGPDPDEHSRRLAAESLAADDPTGWFERLYAEARDGEAVVPWDRGAPDRLLVEWTHARGVDGGGRRALVVGSGLGDDAEHVAGLGYETVGFDVAATAVATARSRFPDTAVRYVTADVLDPPAEWSGAFALVVECINVQALPERLHARAIATAAYRRAGRDAAGRRRRARGGRAGRRSAAVAAHALGDRRLRCR